jgi:lipoprotein-anchoring transpeptidase ErfK/SrfK
MQGSRYRSAVGCSSGCTLQVLLAAVAAVVFGWPERALAQAYGAVPETMQIEDQPGYVPNPEDERLPAIYQRQVVFYRTTESPGTIIVQTSERFLYVVQPNNRAIRYGIGVGRDGFQWSGLLKITRKAEWPDWTPPPEMIARQPYLLSAPC